MHEVQPLLFEMPGPPPVEGIEIVEADAGAYLASMDEGCAALCVYDPPWSYDNATRGSAEGHYGCLSIDDILEHVALSYRVARADSYLLVWCTWPTVMEFLSAAMTGGDGERLERMEQALGGWRYISGGCWTKWDGIRPGQPGIGFHWRGDSEPLLLFKKGKPKPSTFVRNAMVEAYEGPGPWVEPKTPKHSEKPVSWLVQLLQAYTEPGDLVVEVYGGTCPTARAARSTRRRCVSLELDEDRAAMARVLLAQHH